MSNKTHEQISEQMRHIRKVDTKPELVVRRLAHRLGYRYRLHRRDLPGTPDLVFPSRQKVVMVHGCFWHQHQCPLGGRPPRANTNYWLPKLARNRQRDLAAQHALEELGWSVLVVWECETRVESSLATRLSNFLK